MTVWKSMTEFCSRRGRSAIATLGVGSGAMLGLGFWLGWRLCHSHPSWAGWLALLVAAGSGFGVSIALRSILRHRFELERVLESQKEVLREKEQRLEWALAATGDGVWDWKIKSGSINHNPQWCKILGLDHRFLEHELDAFEKQIHPEDKPLVMERIARSLETGEPYTSEHRMLRGDGKIVHVIDRGNIVERNEHGEPTRMVGSMVDITERKLAEEELRETNIVLEEQTARASTLAAEAEFASVTKSDFLANMSHEIRTPMNGVIGMAGLLLDTQLDPLQRKYAEIVRQSGESLLGLLNDILDLSKIEAGKLELENIPFHLAELLEETAALLSVRAAQKGLEFVWAVDSAVPRTISADPGRIRQILTNLAGNAIKFTEKGRVSVMVALESQSETQVVLRFSVQDTGIGIPPEKIKGLCQKFVQVDASTTRKYGGTGLGLAISRQLAELMGSRLEIESVLGSGSVFSFRAGCGLGPVEAVADRKVSRKFSLGGNEGKFRVLVAEDNQVNQLVAVGILEKFGLRVDVVANGLEALRSLESLPYDLVFMDVLMPEMDGFEATSQIRDPKSPVLDHRIPIVAMTANAMRGDRENCIAAGMDDYVSKPVNPREVSAVLERWLRRGGAKVQAPFKSAPQQSLPVYDRTALLERMMGNESILAKVVKSFADSMEGQLVGLEQALTSGDMNLSAQLAHGIKGASANASAKAASALAAQLEDACLASRLQEAIEVRPRLVEAFERWKEAAQKG